MIRDGVTGRRGRPPDGGRAGSPANGCRGRPHPKRGVAAQDSE